MSADDGTPRVSPRHWRKTLLAVLTFAAIFFLCVLAWRQRREIAALLADADLVWLIVGLLLLLLSNLSASVFFLHFVRREGATGGSAPLILGIFLFSQVAKYVPGRIWAIVMQAGMMKGGMGVSALAVANIELALVLIASSVGLGGAALVWVFLGTAAGAVTLLLAALTCYVMLRARFTRRLVDVVAVMLGRDRGGDATATTKIGRDRMRWVNLAACVGFAISCFGGWLLIFASGFGFGLHDGLLLVSALLFAAVAGMISMLPGGLGVREAAMLAFAGWGELGGGDLAAAAISTRLCILVVDAMSAVVGGVLVRRDGKRRD